jgi:hypothetical protein
LSSRGSTPSAPPRLVRTGSWRPTAGAGQLDDVWQTLELLAVELRDAMDLVGCASKGTARKILTAGGNRRVEVMSGIGGGSRKSPPLACP